MLLELSVQFAFWICVRHDCLFGLWLGDTQNGLVMLCCYRTAFVGFWLCVWVLV